MTRSSTPAIGSLSEGSEGRIAVQRQQVRCHIRAFNLQVLRKALINPSRRIVRQRSKSWRFELRHKAKRTAYVHYVASSTAWQSSTSSGWPSFWRPFYFCINSSLARALQDIQELQVGDCDRGAKVFDVQIMGSATAEQGASLHQWRSQTI